MYAIICIDNNVCDIRTMVLLRNLKIYMSIVYNSMYYSRTLIFAVV